MDRGRGDVGQAEQMAKPVHTVDELLVGPDDDRHVGHSAGVGAPGTVQDRGKLSGHESDDEGVVGKLDEREAARPVESAHAPVAGQNLASVHCSVRTSAGTGSFPSEGLNPRPDPLTAFGCRAGPTLSAVSSYESNVPEVRPAPDKRQTRGQLRTAFASVFAAGALVVLKLGSGLVTGSLGLVSAGIESSGDVVTALLTLFAIRLGGRPADENHPYGHRRAENLAALGEAAILTGGGIVVVVEAIGRLAGRGRSVDVHWYVLVVVAVALAVDASRTLISLRGAARYRSAALRSNAF